MGNGTPLERQTGRPWKLLLRQHQSPGDVLVLTAAIESLHRRYPGEYMTAVRTTCDDIFRHNPRVSPLSPHECHIVDMHYPGIHESDQRPVHFMQAFCEYLSAQIGRPVPLLTTRPHLYLGPDEDHPLDAVRDIGPYVVVNAGRKSDYTAKFASTAIWQEVVDHFRGRVQFVQIGERNPSHHHPPLDGVVDLVGRTDFRQLFRLVKYSVAAAGPVSFLLHVSAALGVPYVCLAGGREAASWVSYNTTHYLHTQGMLDCCKERACWKSRTVPLRDGDSKDRSLCSLPVVQPDGEVVPKCLALVGSAGVIEALDRVLASRA